MVNNTREIVNWKLFLVGIFLGSLYAYIQTITKKFPCYVFEEHQTTCSIKISNNCIRKTNDEYIAIDRTSNQCQKTHPVYAIHVNRSDTYNMTYNNQQIEVMDHYIAYNNTNRFNIISFQVCLTFKLHCCPDRMWDECGIMEFKPGYNEFDKITLSSNKFIEFRID